MLRRGVEEFCKATSCIKKSAYQCGIGRESEAFADQTNYCQHKQPPHRRQPEALHDIRRNVHSDEWRWSDGYRRMMVWHGVLTGSVHTLLMRMCTP